MKQTNICMEKACLCKDRNQKVNQVMVNTVTKTIKLYTICVCVCMYEYMNE